MPMIASSRNWKLISGCGTEQECVCSEEISAGYSR
jgi:hypothetical protein